MFDHILVPTDGSDGARRSLRRAGALAERYDARITLLHVVDGMTLQLAGVDSLPDTSGRQRAAADAAEVLSGQAEKVLADGQTVLEEWAVPVETTTRVGPPAETIANVACAEGVDLTVVGDRGRSRLEQVFTGSVPVRLFRRTTLPLWISKRNRAGEPMTVDDIVFPVDDSPIAEETARYVAAVAGEYDATLHLVSVVGKRHPELGTLEGKVEDKARAALAGAAEGLDDRIEVTTTLRHGRPSAEIVAHAREHDTDLISMGASPKRTLLRTLMMPIAERVIRRADRPVLTVRTGLPASPLSN